MSDFHDIFFLNQINDIFYPSTDCWFQQNGAYVISLKGAYVLSDALTAIYLYFVISYGYVLKILHF